MKKTEPIRFVFTVFSVCLFLIAATSLTMSIKSAVHADGYSDKQSRSAQMSADKSYIVRQEGERVFLYDKHTNRLIRELDLCPVDLPDEDRALLQCGLIVDGDAALAALIEDYS